MLKFMAPNVKPFSVNSKQDGSFHAQSSTMTSIYVYNLFAGIICTKCKCAVNLVENIIRSLYLHELSAFHHPDVTTLSEKQEIAAAYEGHMKEMAVFVRTNRQNVHTVRNELSVFLNEKECCYFKCNFCDRLVSNRKNHFGGRHFLMCVDTQRGRIVQGCERNDPRVVPSPIPMDDLSIFCAKFRKFYHSEESDDLEQVAQGLTVTNESTVVVQPTPNQEASPIMPTDSAAQVMLDEIFDIQNERFLVDNADRIVQIHDHFAEPNLWLLRAGYDIHLKGLNMMQLFRLASQPIQDDEVNIRRIWTRVASITNEAIDFVKSIDRSNLVLMEVKRIDQSPSNKPFNTTIKPETWEKYKRVLQKVVTIVFRVEYGDPGQKRYKLTNEQQTLFGIATEDVDDTQNDSFYIQLLFSLLRQRIIEKSYECILLSALAIMSIKHDATYAPPNDVTPFYAALIALFRALILFAARNFPVNRDGFLANAAAYTDALMIHPTSSQRPGPMAWIFRTFSYAQVISQNTMQPGRCFWDNDVLVYRGAHFSMVKFRLMLSHFIAKAKALLADLLLLPSEHTGLDIPMVQWDNLFDDLYDNSSGYSFLSDSRNKWLTDKNGFIYKKLRDDPDLTEKWIDKESKTINQSTLNEYSEKLEEFRKILFGLIHFSAGQPARGTEVSNVRFENTSTPRNIIIERRLVAIRTSYHKMMLQTEKGKQIYRYLPPCIGEILVHYLWLVLPFYQTVKGHAHGSRMKSKFLWSKDLVYPLNKQVERRDLWHTGKFSSILDFMTSTTMGFSTSISSWRHIAIAISRRFLKRAFNDPSDDDDDDDCNDIIENETVNNIGSGGRSIQINEVYDLQASHSVRVANNVYATLIHSPSETPMNIVDAYRHVSIEWHCLSFRLMGSQNDT